MGKILDAEFRKTLYKGLVDAGYEKEEAQKIVGVKYSVALKEDLLKELNVAVETIESESYDNFTINTEEIMSKVEELKKMKEFLEKSS
jgi:tellurite resistance protein